VALSASTLTNLSQTSLSTKVARSSMSLTRVATLSCAIAAS
jgi:hypothetical protein